MTAAQVLLELVEAEVVLWVEDGRLRFRAPEGAVTDAVRERVAACRGGLVALVRARAVLGSNLEDWPADARDDFEERAGFHEFEGGLARAEAERAAELAVRLDHTRRFVKRGALGRS